METEEKFIPEKESELIVTKINPEECHEQEEFKKYSGIIEGRTVYTKDVVDLRIDTGTEKISTSYRKLRIPAKYFKCGDKVDLYGQSSPPENSIEKISYIYNKTRNIAFKLEEILLE